MVRISFFHEEVRVFEVVWSACSAHMERYSSRSDACIGPVNNNRRAVSLAQTAPALMGDVKVEEVLAGKATEKGVDPSSNGRNA